MSKEGLDIIVKGRLLFLVTNAKTKNLPGLGFRALQAMSSASITIMWLWQGSKKKRRLFKS